MGKNNYLLCTTLPFSVTRFQEALLLPEIGSEDVKGGRKLFLPMVAVSEGRCCLTPPQYSAQAQGGAKYIDIAAPAPSSI
jgi:hypothetical protein